MTAALRRVRGVSHANVERRRDEAVVVRTVGQAPDAALVQAVRRAGYGAEVIPVSSCTIAVDMSRAGSAERVRSALNAVAGVRAVQLDSGSSVRVDYDRRRASETALVQAVRRAGFEDARSVAPVRAGRQHP